MEIFRPLKENCKRQKIDFVVKKNEFCKFLEKFVKKSTFLKFLEKLQNN